MKKILSIILLLLLFGVTCNIGGGNYSLSKGILEFPLSISIPFGVAFIFYQFKDKNDNYPLYTIVFRWKTIIISSLVLSFIGTFSRTIMTNGIGYYIAFLTLFKHSYEELFVKEYFDNKDNDKKTEIKTSEKTSKKNTNDFLCLACGKKIGCDDTFCKHCGKKIKKVLKYCKYCGNKLNANFECEKCGKKYKNDDFLFVIFFLSLIIIGFALLIYALNS